MFIKTTSILGLLLLERPTFKDERGFMREVFHLDELEVQIGKKFQPVQWNHSMSYPNVIRALHGEDWNKLVYPMSGEVFSAIVDIRLDSPTFRTVETFTFNDENRRALFIPKGLANSICVIGDQPAHYMYLVDAYYDGGDTRGVAWDDPDLKINWPVKNPILSDRDKNNPKLRDLFPEKFS